MSRFWLAIPYKSVKKMIKKVHPSRRALALGVMERAQWFSRFDATTLDRFLDEGRIQFLQRGETLCRRGDTVNALCIVVEGALDVRMTAATGKRHIVTHLEPGQLMNLIPILDSGRAIHDACAHEETTVLLIPRDTFLQAVDAEPGVARAMVRVLCVRSRLLYEAVSDHALLSLRARCARLLLSLMNSYGLPRPEGVAISLKLSQDEIADMLGCTRQSANRELKELQRENIIEMTYSRFIVRDQQALEAIVSG